MDSANYVKDESSNTLSQNRQGLLLFMQCTFLSKDINSTLVWKLRQRRRPICRQVPLHTCQRGWEGAFCQSPCPAPSALTLPSWLRPAHLHSDLHSKSHVRSNSLVSSDQSSQQAHCQSSWQLITVGDDFSACSRRGADVCYTTHLPDNFNASLLVLKMSCA